MFIENFLSNIQGTGVFILVLSILIFVHEWGHFITAKYIGVEVEEFALGFGPTLFAKYWKGTTYMLKTFPLGGYVRMVGDERDKCTGKPEEFYSKPPGLRALVVLNGPVVNFIFAYISFVFVFMLGYPGLSTKVSEIIESGPAQIAGMMTGDKITAIDDQRIYGWTNLEKKLEGETVAPVKVTFLRNEQELTATLTPDIILKPDMLGRERYVRDLGIGALANTIGGVSKNSPAQEAGLKEGDQIIEIDGKKIYDWTSLQKNVLNSKNGRIVIKILRNGKILVKAVTPEIITTKDEFGNDIEKRRIGVGPIQEFDSFRFGFLESCSKAYEELMFITVMTYKSFYRIITGAISAKESVTGPVGIFYIVKGASEAGLSHLLYILGVISASLAIFNLLPVIPLDGGHLFLIGLEKIRGKALSQRVDDYIARAGFSLIILLALFVFYSDFSRFGLIDKIKNLFL